MKTIPTLLAAIIAASTFCATAQAADQPTRPVAVLKVKLPDGRTAFSTAGQGDAMRVEDFVRTSYIKSCEPSKLQIANFDAGIKVRVIASNATALGVEIEVTKLNNIETVKQQGCVVQLLKATTNGMSALLPYGAAPQKIEGYEVSAELQK